MKKTTFLLVFCFLTYAISNAQITVIPDTNFEQALIDLGIDTNGLNGNILNVDAAGETGALFLGSRNISDLTGIEAFENITELFCGNNQLTNLNFSQNTALTRLSILNNNLSSLDVSQLSVLNFLECGGNQLTNLDVTQNTALTFLSCSQNQISSLNLNFNTNLIELYCSNNPLGSLGLTQNTMLQILYCDNADLTGLNLSQNTALTNLFIANNNLSSLNLTSNQLLKTINCISNNFTSLDLSQNLILETLNCNNNQLTSLDLSQNLILETLNCNNNQLTSLDISNSLLITDLNCGSNMLTNLDLSRHSLLETVRFNNNNFSNFDIRNGNNTAITNYSGSNNPLLTCVFVDNVAYSNSNWLSKDPITNYVENQTQCDPFVTYVPDDNFEQALIDLGYDNFLDDYVNTSAIDTVTTLSIGNLGINDLTGIEDFIALETLNCAFNNLNSLDVSNAPNLLQLFCFDNNLTTLDVTNNTALEWLDCKNNNLSVLDVSNNTVLEKIDFQDNNLTTLNIGWSTALQQVRVQNNQLQTLDVRSGANTNIAIFDTTGNPTLSCIFVDNAAYSTSNWSNIDATSTFVENQAQCNALVIFVPDDNFEQALIDLGYDSGPLDDFVLKSSINTITTLNLSSKNIFEFTGIGAFGALENLNISQNPITQSFTFNVTNLTALRILNCSNTQLTSLDVSNNTALTNLKCNNNQLANLDVTQNTALTQLWCHNNQFTSLNVSQNTVLSQLYCSTNSLTTLDVTQNTVLNELRCQVNSLTSIDVSQNTSLVELWCRDNQITSLDLSQNVSLAELICNNNQLTSLNIKNGNNTAITNANFNATNNPSLTCIQVDDVTYSDTNWTNIDAQSGFSTNCSATTYVPDNNFEQALIDLGYDTVLDDYVLTFNISSVTSLDISNKNIADLTGIEDFISLVFFDCYTNQISNIDVSNSPALVQLKCGTNQLTSLDVSSNTNLTILNCFDNQLTSLDVKNGNNTNVTFFKADNNPNLTCISVDDIAYATTNFTNIDAQTHFSTNCGAETYVPDDNFEQALIDLGYDDVLNDYVVTTNISGVTALNLNNKNIVDLTGIEGFTALISLVCNDNQLTGLNLNQNIALKSLFAGGNNLTSLDVTSNIALEQLSCFANNLTDLDITQNINLMDLDCGSNQLTSLDVSQNTALEGLQCYTNNITSLDISQNTALSLLIITGNQITTIDTSQNTALTYLNCSNNDLTSLDVKNGNNTNFTYFNTFNNPNLTCIEVDNAAYSTTNWINIDIQTSFNINCASLSVDDERFLNLKLYPNPTSSFIFIDIPQGMSISKIIVYNITGKEIITETEFLDNKLNIKNLQSGFYFLSITIDNHTVLKRIIVE